MAEDNVKVATEEEKVETPSEEKLTEEEVKELEEEIIADKEAEEEEEAAHSGKELMDDIGKLVKKHKGPVGKSIKGFFGKIKDSIVRFFKFGLIPAFLHADWAKIPVSTYVRWILMILVSVNTVLMHFGLSPIKVDENRLAEGIAIILNIVVLVMNTYKNNSTSKEALIADEIMHALKAAGASESKEALDKINDVLHDLNKEEYVESDYVAPPKEEEEDDEDDE